MTRSSFPASHALLFLLFLCQSHFSQPLSFVLSTLLLLYCNSLICSSYPHFHCIIIFFHFIAPICIICSLSYPFFMLCLYISFVPTLLHHPSSRSNPSSLLPFEPLSPSPPSVFFFFFKCSFPEYLSSADFFQFLSLTSISSSPRSNTACLCTAGAALISPTSLLSPPAPPVRLQIHR